VDQTKTKRTLPDCHFRLRVALVAPLLRYTLADMPACCPTPASATVHTAADACAEKSSTCPTEPCAVVGEHPAPNLIPPTNAHKRLRRVQDAALDGKVLNPAPMNRDP
jgi:hypothetical protein